MIREIRSRRVAILCLCLGLASAALAEDFWQKKPYTKWSKSEVEKMLSDSPWTHSATLGAVALLGVGRSTGPIGGTTAASGMPSISSGSGADTGRESNPQVIYTAQVRSARTMREAIVRQLQIQAKYDSLSDEQKKAVDARTDEYLNAPQDAIVIYVRFHSNIPNYLAEVRRYWVQQNTELLKTHVYLSVGGQRLSPVAYVAGDDAFQFSFERPAELPKDGSAVLEFVHPAVGVIASQRVVFEFKLSKMQSQSGPAM